ncbi:MAG: TIM barrel protein [Phycisphaeraceae bacterium]|nr:TIM barrel protein [Phycisphaeraceae bacterium]MCW5764071.1 TIM barrel protein [Phycisphaeraceae bacterium]
MERRTFLATAAAASAFSLAPSASGHASASRTASIARRAGDFKMAYAPHFGMFGNLAGGDAVAQLEFAREQGFTAWEDNGMMGRSEDEQKRIAAAMERLGIRMGVFVCNPGTAWKHSFCARNKDDREQFLSECRQAVECAKRVNATWMTVVPGRLHDRLHEDVQTAYAIEQLRMAADIFEPHNLVMVLEPLNPFRDHPGMLLARSTHAYAICKGVNSPSCKILFDIYHQQITEGNLIPNIDTCWDEIAYFQIGDNPGRREPTTGEINYRNIFKHLANRKFTGILGMEHGNSRGGSEGDQAVIDAYRACDDF